MGVRGPDGDGTEEAAYCQIEAARGADMIVKASGVGIFDEFLEAAVLTLKTPSNLVIFWEVDAPATHDRIEGDPADAFHKCIPRYNFILAYGEGFPFVRAYESQGAKLLRADLQRARSRHASSRAEGFAVRGGSGPAGEPPAGSRAPRRAILPRSLREVASQTVPVSVATAGPTNRSRRT